MIHYGIKNFRKFDSKGCEFSLAPITFFTGCNNSGKSSVSKSLVLLSQMYKRLNSLTGFIPFDELYLDFSNQVTNLGEFKNALNRKAKINEGIVVSFSTFSNYIQREIFVECVFKKRDSESHNRAHLASFNIKDKFHREIIHGIEEGGQMILGIPDEAGIELWFFEQMLCFIFQQNKCLLSSKQRKEIADLLSGVKETSHDWLLFMDYFKGAAVGDLFIDKDEASSIVNKLSLIVTALRTHRAPFLDFLDGNGKNNCIENIKNFIKSHQDESSSLIFLLRDFSKSSCQTFSEYVYRILKNTSNIYISKGIEHRRKVSIWRNSFRGSHISYGEISLDKTEANRVLNIIKKVNAGEELTHIDIPQEDISVIKKLRFFKIANLFSLYTAICSLSDEVKKGFLDSKRLFPGHELFIHLLGYVLCDVFLQRDLDPDLFYCPYDNNKYCNFNGINYIGTTSVSIKRLYSESDSSDLLTSLILKEKKDFSFTNKWLWKLGLGNFLEIVPAPQGIGFFIYIVSNRGGHSVKSLLPDLGCGVGHLLVLLLLVDAWAGKKEYLDGRFYPTLILEEPEAHLHPSFQSHLADIFLDAYRTYGVHFIIETHSEYLLRKSQVLVARMKFTSNDESASNAPFKAYYFPKTGKPYSLGYRKDGYFANSFGKGFYDESSSLTYELL